MMKFYNDYPTKPIGGGNPYQMCASCGMSVPAINGFLENHTEWCEYRKAKLVEEELELLKIELECLRLDAQKPVYCVARGWSSEPCGSGEDLGSMEIFSNEKDALAYKAELEAGEDLWDSSEYVVIIEKLIN